MGYLIGMPWPGMLTLIFLGAASIDPKGQPDIRSSKWRFTLGSIASLAFPLTLLLTRWREFDWDFYLAIIASLVALAFLLSNHARSGAVLKKRWRALGM